MAVTLNANTSTGFIATSDTSGVLQLQTGGTAAVTVSAAQNVGIGTASPAEILHLSSASPRLTFTSTNNSSGARYDTVGTATTGSHRFQYNGTEVLTVGISGQTVALQNGTVSSGAGIAFPATQSASTDVNTLDDYEEGTWTPVDGSASSLSFSIAFGWYTKVGRVVHAHFSVTYPSTASATRAAIGGLPFTVLNATYANFGGALGYTDSSLVLGCHLDPGFTTLNFYRNDGLDATNTQLSLKQVRFVVTYFV